MAFTWFGPEIIFTQKAFVAFQKQMGPVATFCAQMHKTLKTLILTRGDRILKTL